MRKVKPGTYEVDNMRLLYLGCMMWAVYRRNEYTNEHAQVGVIVGGSETKFGAEQALDRFNFQQLEL